MKKILDFFRKSDIPNPPWDYDFIYNLDEREYPKYLAKIFKLNTGEDIDLTPPSFPPKGGWSGRGFNKNIQTFNQKIQWLKLYDVTPLKKLCTDKVTVRDYVKEKIGAEYLKPALQIITKDKLYINYNHYPSPYREGKQTDDMQVFNYPIECYSMFDKIDFDSLPCSFVMKCSHGCKWQYIIKDKETFLKNKGFFEAVRMQMTGWLEQEFWAFGGFEMQYKGLEPKIIIEPLMRDNINEICPEIMVWCFSGMPKFILYQRNKNEHTPYDENLNITEDLIPAENRKLNIGADENVRLAFELSKVLSKPFIFVRCDFMLYQNKLYFEELTFTPYSGFIKFKNQDVNIKLGNLCNLDKKEDFMNKIDELDEESINELYDKSVNFIYNARSKPCSTVLWNQALYGADK